MSSQPPENQDPEPQSQTDVEPILGEAKQAADERDTATATAKPPWWKFWAKR